MASHTVNATLYSKTITYLNCTPPQSSSSFPLSISPASSAIAKQFFQPTLAFEMCVHKLLNLISELNQHWLIRTKHLSLCQKESLPHIGALAHWQPWLWLWQHQQQQHCAQLQLQCSLSPNPCIVSLTCRSTGKDSGGGSSSSGRQVPNISLPLQSSLFFAWRQQRDKALQHRTAATSCTVTATATAAAGGFSAATATTATAYSTVQTTCWCQCPY